MKTSKLILIACVVAFFSCKKKDNTENTPPTPMGTIGFHLHTNIDTAEADSGEVITNYITHQRYQLDVAQFYISGIVAYKTDGTAEPLNNAYLLKNIDQEEYIIGQVPTGNYKSISFNVGIDAATNQTDPTTHTGVLAVQDPSMWFGWQWQGYIFMNVQGYADTTATHTGQVNKAFTYQLGGNNELKNIHMPDRASGTYVTVTTSNTNTLPAEFHIICDYGILLNGVNFKTNNGAATPYNSDSTIVKAIESNIPNMFRYEE